MRLILVVVLMLSSCLKEKKIVEASCDDDVEKLQLAEKEEPKDSLFEEKADEGCKVR